MRNLTVWICRCAIGHALATSGHVCSGCVSTVPVLAGTDRTGIPVVAVGVIQATSRLLYILAVSVDTLCQFTRARSVTDATDIIEFIVTLATACFWRKEACTHLVSFWNLTRIQRADVTVIACPVVHATFCLQLVFTRVVDAQILRAGFPVIAL